MSQLAHLLSHWTHCPPQTRDTLFESMYEQISRATSLMYRVEAAGSGTVLGRVTRPDLQTWLKTHKLCLGHGGARITNIAHIPYLFKGPIVAVKKVFQGKLHKTLKTQSKEITCVAWHPSGIYFAGGIHDALLTLEIKNDNAIKLWTKDGDFLQTLRGHTKGVLSVAWSPDGQTLASGSIDRTIKLWGCDGKLIKTLYGHTSWVNCVAWSPNGQTLASGSNDASIKLWSRDGELLKTLYGHTNMVRCVAWSPDGQILASGSIDRTIKLWSKDGELMHTLSQHTGRIDCVAWHPQGYMLTSCSGDGTVRFWTTDGTLVETLVYKNWVRCVAWSPDGTILAIKPSGTVTKFWTMNGEPIPALKGRTFTGQFSFQINAFVVWHPDKDVLLVSTFGCSSIDFCI